MKNGKFINITSYLIPVFVSLIIFSTAKIPYYPKPRENFGLPPYVKWNSYNGEYYNFKIFKWNPLLKSYSQIDKSTQITTPHPYDMQKNLRHWKEKHKYSKALLDKRLIMTVDNVPSGMIRLSYFNPYMDNRLKYMSKLGIEEVPNMLLKVKDDSVIAERLKFTIDIMTNTTSGPFNLSDEGRYLWTLNYIAKVKNSKYIIETAYNRLKMETNKKAIEKIKKEITDVGIWALPDAYEKYKKGNDEVLNIFKEAYGEAFINMDIEKINYVKKILYNFFNENNNNKYDNFWIYPEALDHQ